MNTVIIANIFTLIGQGFSLIGSTRKKKEEILIFQSIFMAIVSISSCLLGGYSAIVPNIVGIIRNILSIKKLYNEKINYILIVCTVIFGIILNNNGILGYLIIVANLVQSTVILNKNSSTKDVQMVCCFSSLCWAVFNIAIKSYVGAVFNIFNAGSYLFNALSKRKE
jgi:membrane-associated HD superfamily phosphohydrolase